MVDNDIMFMIICNWWDLSNVIIILGGSDSYRDAIQANPDDPPADNDPVKAENPNIRFY